MSYARDERRPPKMDAVAVNEEVQSKWPKIMARLAESELSERNARSNPDETQQGEYQNK